MHLTAPIPAKSQQKSPKPLGFRQKNGADGRIRTGDLLITNQLLYQLSYKSKFTLIIFCFKHYCNTYIEKDLKI